jgi:hypothetical protein
MNAHNNKLVVRRYFEEVLLNGRSELIEELFAPQIRSLVRRFAFFASESFSISEMVVEGDSVMVHWRMSPSSDEQFSQNGFAVCHLEGGVIVGLEMMDFNGILCQIGAEIFSPAY